MSHSISRSNSEKLFQKAKTYFPGGVNSPVRAFKSVDGNPLFIKRGDGYKIWDEDGNEFIDFCASWGPLILGHNHPAIYRKVVEALQNGTSFGAPTALENELAELILSRNPFIDKIRFVSSGTEAVMSALRLARGYTGRNKVVKFEGCYHGHTDAMLVKAGSGLVTFGESSSAGVPAAFVNETLVLPLNDEAALRSCFQQHGFDIACAIIEPIPANNGLLLQGGEFLKTLRSVCSEYGALLFFDEVISGFRVSFNGAAAYYGITPDIITYGKIIGGGLPVGAYGAREEIMSCVSPDGPVYQAGTLSGNPVAMAAGIAQLTVCAEEGFYQDQEKRTKAFVENVNTYAKEKGYDFEFVTIGSIFWFNFDGKKNITRADQINPDMSKFKQLHAFLLNNGVYIGPSGYEVGFISSVHNPEILKKAAEVIKQGLDHVMAE
ncbi:glutamate-1-semialdehyde 2,1-aminomutase [Crocinitomicaceae bacterium CZZ-1]|uniref:Glutamate-1-semialdehyde 2,1-aminomutase n=1 Tax=Taishania pollutisoli TaxID=2766479 RepID=A0A8J6PN91_9FLAO|nr:glutamate-1-semialdehyde 2,1-aminomutase [Taishania pollutisoli]MBC9811403.1 glutamate-1-semialdehyde 2,1-aminomutase [Taishania pollutisoli]MBX2947682.1 glutamate-1-semialdehyde 2,1-aminomutase [Crocinitomicaceae bacterium]NGF75183.1 glutamate-1-semialdehyde 2,1-aminomutase [Fluviicola sp. SGL-29]